MVSGGGGDQSPVLLLLREGADLVVGPPELVGPSGLHVLRLEIHVVAAGFGQVGGINQRRGPQYGLENAPGRFEGFQGEHIRFSFVTFSIPSYHTELRGRSQS